MTSRGLEECSNLLRSKWWKAVELDLNYKLSGPKAYVLFPSLKEKEAALAVATTTTSLSSISWLFSTGASQWALVTPEDRQFPSRTSQLLLLSPLVHTDWLFLVYSSKPFSKLPCLWPRLQTPPSEKESDRLCWLNNRCFHFSQDEIVVFNKRPPLPFFLFLSLSFPPSHSTLKQQHFSHVSGSFFCHCWPREQRERE